VPTGVLLDVRCMNAERTGRADVDVIVNSDT
jgi:hypothetical protein